MIIKTNNLIYNIILFFPTIHSLLMLFSDSLSRKFALIFFVVLWFKLILSKKRSNIYTCIFLLIFISINAIRFGIDYVLHQDFYGYILLILIFYVFQKKRNMYKMEQCIYNEKITNYAVISYFGVLLLSILMGKGLCTSQEWGVSMPLLYGPYGLPHSTAYQLLIMYMMSSIMYARYKKKLYVSIMVISVAFVMWTGVRSAFLVMALLVFLDFNAIEKMSTKIIIATSGCFILLYLLLFTDVIVSNPVIQKTLVAFGKNSGITNGRTDFNSYLTGKYLHATTFTEKVFGMGMDKLRMTMALRYGNTLHAHNDVLNALVGMGAIGLVTYMWFFISFCKRYAKPIICFLILFILAFTNGLYMYIAFTPCIPIIPIYLKNVFMRLKNDEHYDY